MRVWGVGVCAGRVGPRQAQCRNGPSSFFFAKLKPANLKPPTCEGSPYAVFPVRGKRLPRILVVLDYAYMRCSRTRWREVRNKVFA